MLRRVLIFILLLLLVLPTLARTLIADVSVSITIPPKQSDFTFSLTPANTNSTVSQNTLLTYTIDYGALASAGLTTTATIQATYTTDPTAGVNLMDYVSNSATKGHNNESAVIDPVNHTITWTISLAPNVSDSVSFSLKTNANYTGTTSIPLTIHATGSNQYVSFGDVTDTKNYVFDASQVTPTATPSPTPTTGPTPTSGLTPPAGGTPTTTPIITNTPTPNLIQPGPNPTPPPHTIVISTIDVSEINSNSITFTAITNFPVITSLSYGTSQGNLSSKVADSTPATNHTFVLSNLSPTTTYFAQFVTGTTVSDILTATTAQPSVPQRVNMQTVSFNSGDIPLIGAQNRKNNATELATASAATVVLPKNQSFEVTFQMIQTTPIKSLVGIIKQKNVLGINTFTQQAYANETQIPVIEKTPGVYTLNLTTPAVPGQYDLFIQIVDTSGNLTRQRIGTMNISHPFTVRDATTKNGIVDARVALYRYDFLSKKYVLLPTVAGNNKNPSYSNAGGELDLVLPPGDYMAIVSSFMHEEKRVTFTIGGESTEQYPTVSLAYNPWNLSYLVRYIQNSFTDAWSNALVGYELITRTHRLFNILTVLSIMLLITALITFLFRKRIKSHIGLHFFVKEIFAMLMNFCILMALILLIVFTFSFGVLTTGIPILAVLVSCFLWFKFITYIVEEK